MVGLLDLKVASEKVRVGDNEVEVKGISLDGVAEIVVRFPPLKTMLLEQRDVTLSFEDIIQYVPEAVAVVIAYGCGLRGNADAEKKAKELSANDQAELVAAIIRLTAPEGIGPFVAKIAAILRSNNRDEDRGKAQATTSRKQSSS